MCLILCLNVPALLLSTSRKTGLYLIFLLTSVLLVFLLVLFAAFNVIPMVLLSSPFPLKIAAMSTYRNLPSFLVISPLMILMLSLSPCMMLLMNFLMLLLSTALVNMEPSSLPVTVNFKDILTFTMEFVCLNVTLLLLFRLFFILAISSYVLKHPNQTPTCRKCSLPGHVVKECPYQICFNCDNVGHVSRDCLEPVRSTIWHKVGHYAIDCDYSWQSHSVRHTAADPEVPPPHQPPPSQLRPLSLAPDVPSSTDIIPPTQSSQPSQPSQPSQLSQPSAAPSTTESDALLAAALPPSDVVASPEPSPTQPSGSSTATTSASSGSSSSSSAQPTSCSSVPDGTPDISTASSTQESSSSPLLFSSSVPEPAPDVFQPPIEDGMGEDTGPSALSMAGFIKAVSKRRRKSAVPVLVNRRPAKITNAASPPSRKSTAPTAVSARKKP